MIVCICANVSDRAIKKAMSEGSTTLEDLQIDLGVACKCCSCVPEIRDMLKEFQNEQSDTNK